MFSQNFYAKFSLWLVTFFSRSFNFNFGTGTRIGASAGKSSFSFYNQWLVCFLQNKCKSYITLDS